MYTTSIFLLFLQIVIGKEVYKIPDFNLETATLPWEIALKTLPRESKPTTETEEVGEPLILTPYLEKGLIEEARSLAEVDAEYFLDNVTSFSGYFTVEKKYNSNIWFWYFPSENGKLEETPLIIWLSGGPGLSSLYGLFDELGPFTIGEDNDTVIENPFSWHKNHSILFIDNPVGTGFSFTDSDDGLANNQSKIAWQLYDVVSQFLILFPELQKAPLFLAGESYAGKHVPSLGYEIHERNKLGKQFINLQGLAIGNGFIDPVTLLNYSDFAKQLGFINEKVYMEMKYFEEKTAQFMKEGDTKKAFLTFNHVLSILMSESQLEDIYNFVDEMEPSLDKYSEFIQRPEIRKALHVGKNAWKGVSKVYRKLIPDFMNSAKFYFEKMLDNYRVMCFSGQMDIIVAYPLSVNTYRSLNWKGADAYLNAKRKPWYYDHKVVGYVTTVNNFTEVMVRNAGHMVRSDQPERALKLITSFTYNIPLQTSDNKEDTS